MSFKDLKDKLYQLLIGGAPEGTSMVEALIAAVMMNFWDWLDSLPSDIDIFKTEITPTSRAITRNYITGYLHDLRES